MKKYFSWLFVLGVLIAGVLASRTLFIHNLYFNMHDDLQMMRQLELEKCFKDMQIPCRWVPDMGYGYGFPLFNYYPQLPYLFGEAFRLFTLPFNDVAKLTFALGIMASGLAMYLFASEFFGKKGGMLSAIFYVWAPYRAVDVYVRGAMNESWAWVFFPLILWSVYKLIFSSKLIANRYLLIAAVSTSALLLTHNLMAMIFVPVVALWVVFWLFRQKSVKVLPKLIIAGVIALGLSAFFTVPAVLEQKLVHIDTLTADYFQYAGHFATLNQLFVSRFWGDGPSVFGPGDGLAFPIGQVHWIGIAIVAALLLFKVIKSRKIDTPGWVIAFGILVGTAAAFMSHERSGFIWANISILKFVQFPWRFLTLNVLGYSLAIGGVVLLVPKKLVNLIICLSFVALLFFNWNYFMPVHSGAITDDAKFTGEAWRIQQQAGIRDYLPLSAKDDPTGARKTLAEITKGKGKIENEQAGTNWGKFNVDAEGGLIVRINVFEFPVWKVRVDGELVEPFISDSEEWGRMYINVPEGRHSVDFKLYDTPLRRVSDYVSLISWLGLGTFLVLQFKRGRRDIS